MIAAIVLLAAAAADPVSGTWEGTSICQVRPSPCRDERAIYRVTRTTARHYRFDGYRMVGRKELFMGTIDLTFDPALNQLRGPTLQFTVKGDHLSGRLMLADGTLYRLIEADKR